jgi:tRNA (guanine37-N1)-methyltransferase
MSRPWTATVLTIFPEMFPGPLGLSLAGKALERGLWRLDPVGLRRFTSDRHQTVDDTPFGGGAGMVMRPDIVAQAVDHVVEQGAPGPLVYLSPRGVPLRQALVKELAGGPGVVLLCGRYEGVDHRVREHLVDGELSVGDVVLNGGEVAACLVIEAVVRLLPGAMGNAESPLTESFGQTGLLEEPHYTRPADFRGWTVPDVLRSGDHARVARWRHAQALHRTIAARPDLIEARGGLTDHERALLEEFPPVPYP